MKHAKSQRRRWDRLRWRTSEFYSTKELSEGLHPGLYMQSIHTNAQIPVTRGMSGSGVVQTIMNYDRGVANWVGSRCVSTGSAVGLPRWKAASIEAIWIYKQKYNNSPYCRVHNGHWGGNTDPVWLHKKAKPVAHRTKNHAEYCIYAW